MKDKRHLEISKEVFEEMYNKLSLTRMAEVFGCSRKAIDHRRTTLGIPAKNQNISASLKKAHQIKVESQQDAMVEETPIITQTTEIDYGQMIKDIINRGIDELIEVIKAKPVSEEITITKREDADDEPKRNTNLAMPEHIYLEIKKLAIKRRTSATAIINQAIEAFIERNEPNEMVIFTKINKADEPTPIIQKQETKTYTDFVKWLFPNEKKSKINTYYQNLCTMIKNKDIDLTIMNEHKPFQIVLDNKAYAFKDEVIRIGGIKKKSNVYYVYKVYVNDGKIENIDRLGVSEATSEKQAINNVRFNDRDSKNPNGGYETYDFIDKDNVNEMTENGWYKTATLSPMECA